MEFVFVLTPNAQWKKNVVSNCVLELNGIEPKIGYNWTLLSKYTVGAFVLLYVKRRKHFEINVNFTIISNYTQMGLFFIFFISFTLEDKCNYVSLKICLKENICDCYYFLKMSIVNLLESIFDIINFKHIVHWKVNIPGTKEVPTHITQQAVILSLANDFKPKGNLLTIWTFRLQWTSTRERRGDNVCPQQKGYCACAAFSTYVDTSTTQGFCYTWTIWLF